MQEELTLAAPSHHRLGLSNFWCEVVSSRAVGAESAAAVGQRDAIAHPDVPLLGTASSWCLGAELAFLIPPG